MRRLWITILSLAVLSFDAGTGALAQDLTSPFPLGNYDQAIDHWIKPDAPGYDTPVLSPPVQAADMKALVARYFGTDDQAESPWNGAFIAHLLGRRNDTDLVAVEQDKLQAFDNRGRPPEDQLYGQNLRPHIGDWIDAIAANMNLGAFDAERQYRPTRRAIAVDNILVRDLPTADPAFRDPRLAGEGYPFDDLQLTAAWAGTPLYILSESLDRAWLFVQTPNVIGWVPNRSVARVSEAFVRRWRSASARTLAAVVRTGVPVTDVHGRYRFTAYVGAMFPAVPSSRAGVLRLMVPVMRDNHKASVDYADVPRADAAIMPLPATPRNFSMLMKTLQGRPYGWGNTGFYNDCSAELKNLFTPFGIWLPRNSAYQVTRGNIVDLGDMNPAQRLNYLAAHGKPFLTLVRVPGHIMLYVGNDTRGASPVPMTYQDIWGLRPADNSRRAIIGKSVIFPLLLQYPEDPQLTSLADRSIFQISYLGDAPEASIAASAGPGVPAVPADALLRQAPQ